MTTWVLILWAYSNLWGWGSAATTVPGFNSEQACARAGHQFLNQIQHANFACIEIEKPAMIQTAPREPWLPDDPPQRHQRHVP